MKITKETRALVQRRARNTCEYCRLPQEASILPLQVDHIIGKQHNGSDEPENLCLCCIRCNLKKGPNLASIAPGTDQVVPLFHPRRHSWQEHFHLGADGKIHGLTPEGRATVELLDVNDTERIRLRALLLRRGG